VARNDIRELSVKPSLPGTDMQLLNGGRPFIAKSMAATSDPWIRKWGQANEYLEWYRNDRGSRSICFRAYRESPGLAPPFVVESENGWVALEAWSKYDFMRGDLRGEIRGEHVWITNRRDQGRLHDLRTGGLVWEAPPDSRASIWPGP
jgi:hypothetical protein